MPLQAQSLTEAMIKQNTTRVYLYMTLLTMVIGVLGHFISQSLNWGLTGTGSFLIVAGVINFVAYFFSHKLVLFASGAKPLPPEVSPEYYQLVERLCQRADLPMPELYYVDTDAMNAFATGRDHQHAVVAVTRGLLEKLKPEEIEGVVAHELAHIKFYDMRLMAIISILAGFISILADMYWRSSIVDKASEKDSSGAFQWFGLALALFAPLTGMLIQLAVSRRREFVADAQASAWVGGGNPLAQALRKIAKDQIPLPGTHYSIAHLYISNPFEPDGFLDKIMSTHPPVQERIQQLEQLG